MNNFNYKLLTKDGSVVYVSSTKEIELIDAIESAIRGFSIARTDIIDIQLIEREKTKKKPVVIKCKKYPKNHWNKQETVEKVKQEMSEKEHRKKILSEYFTNKKQDISKYLHF